MTLQLGGMRECRVVIHALTAADDKTSSGDDSGDDRCGGRTETATVWDAVRAHHLKSGRRATEQLESRAHRLHDEMTCVARNARRTHPGHVDRQAGFVSN